MFIGSSGNQCERHWKQKAIMCIHKKMNLKFCVIAAILCGLNVLEYPLAEMDAKKPFSKPNSFCLMMNLVNGEHHIASLVQNLSRHEETTNHVFVIDYHLNCNIYFYMSVKSHIWKAAIDEMELHSYDTNTAWFIYFCSIMVMRWCSIRPKN